MLLTPSTTVTSEGSSNGPRPVVTDAELMQKLGVNIVSIVLGALGFVVVVSWINAVRACCVCVIECETGDKRYREMFNKAFSALLVSLVAIFIGILVYMWYRYRYGGLAP